MLAVDTNVVIRYLAADDPAQFARAVAVIEEEDTFVSQTVLLEIEWVLRSVYRYGAVRIAHVLRSLAGLPRITIEDADVVSTALDWFERGLDFADAIHLAKAQSCDAFVTFDRDLAGRGSGLSAVPVQLIS